MEKTLSRPTSIALGVAYVLAGVTLLWFGSALVTGAGKFNYGK